eukprot:Gb_05350 [translate_table: standard]
MDGKTVALPSGFTERIKDRGCLVSWAPQLSVLSHPSVACFITHCGWNSTLESISMGVPMICWPYFADQFLNRTYIKDEITAAVKRLLLEEEGGEIKKRVIKLKENCRVALKEGGSSDVNYKLFVNAMKKK